MTGINWVLDPGKFLSREEVRELLNTARKRAEKTISQNNKVAVRDYFIVDLALSTGLRVMELASLTCGDVFLNDGVSSLLVKRGKGGKKRLVRFNGSLKRHCVEYIAWKQRVGEPIGPNDPLILSSNTRSHMTTRAIEKVFKRTAVRAGLSSRFSIHCLRHTYACHLYKASGYNLRLVQKQLGHSSSRITEVYADVLNPDLRKSLEKLYA
jgi:site-specific recombinase XerD